MSNKRIRCFVSGAEVDFDQAMILDVRAAQERATNLKEQLDALQRVLDSLGRHVTRTVAGGRTMQGRPLVAPAIATALESGTGPGLFMRFAELRQRWQDADFERARRHPAVRPLVEGMDEAAVKIAFAFGGHMLDALGIDRQLSVDTRIVARAAFGVIGAGRSVASFVDELRAQGPALALGGRGVPAAVIEEVVACCSRPVQASKRP